jgi:hypothetical protein
MLDKLFDWPLIVGGPVIVGSLCIYSLLGLAVVRRWILPRWRIQTVDGEFSGAMLQAIMVFYGLALALIAVNVWETYSDVSKIISQEATALGALYRDSSTYPDPIRSQLQGQLREYTEQVINRAWPMQRRGEFPREGVEIMNRFQTSLARFEPVTEGQKILHAETFRAYNTLILARQLRLDAVATRLPGILWFVVIAGAVISLSSGFFFKIEEPRLQRVQNLLLAVFMGLVIFMILALDRPFRGDLAVKPEPYQLIYDRLMATQSHPADDDRQDKINK